MVVYTLEQRWEIPRHYFENHGNNAELWENCVRILEEEKHRQLVCSLSSEKSERN